MDMRMAARYPFVSEASVIAAENGADVEALLLSETFDSARARGIERVVDAIHNSEVSYTAVLSQFDQLMEILSYPYARMIVSCVNDRFLTKRYALAEAVKMNKLLGEENNDVINFIAGSLGVRTAGKGDDDDDRLKMHFADYLKFSTRIKSTDWKLVNTEMKNGNIYLSKEKFDRLLQNALQDKIESELPLNVPDNYREFLQRDVDHVTMILGEMKSKFSPGFSGELKQEELPPCIRTLLANAQNGMNLPHSGRFAMVSFLHAIGMNSEQILTLFSQSPDFDESKSSYQIRHITGELNGTDGYTPPECSTMKTNGICFDPDSLCANEKVNHPLTYYRIKSGTGRPREEKKE